MFGGITSGRQAAPFNGVAAGKVNQPLGMRNPLAVAPPTASLIKHSKWRGVPRRRLGRVVSRVLWPPVRAKAGVLLTSHGRVRPGGKVSVFAGGLRAKEVMLTLVGPDGYAVESPIAVRSGSAGAVLRLSKRLRPGTYYPAIIDASEVRPGRGSALVALAPLRVTSR